MSNQASTSQTASDPTFRPPRPPNPWILFRSDRSRELSAQKIPQSQVSKIVSDNWRYASAEVKNFYAAKAAEAKAAHAAKYPGYRFAPQKKETAEPKHPAGRKTSGNTREARQQAAAPYTIPVRATTTASPAPVMHAPVYGSMPIPIPIPIMHAPRPLYPDAAEAVYMQPDSPFGYLGPSPSMDFYSPGSPIIPSAGFAEEVDEAAFIPSPEYQEVSAESLTDSPTTESVETGTPTDRSLPPIDEVAVPFTTGGMSTEFVLDDLSTSFSGGDNASGLYLPSPTMPHDMGGSLDAGPSSWEPRHISPLDQGADMNFDWMMPSQNDYSDNSQDVSQKLASSWLRDSNYRSCYTEYAAVRSDG